MNEVFLLGFDLAAFTADGTAVLEAYGNAPATEGCSPGAQAIRLFDYTGAASVTSTGTATFEADLIGVGFRL